MKRACVIGWPIKHSRSPMIHGYWLKQYGIDGSYERIAVEPEALPNFLSTLEANGFAGCNVTVPHKERAFALAEERDASARAVGAANTLWLQNGRLCAANTDTYGFMANLASAAPGWNAAQGPALLLGAGGSARAVVYGLLEAGAKDVRVFNRSQSRALEVVRHFGDRVSAHEWSSRNDHVPTASLIVNTTTLGMNDEGNPEIDFGRARPDCVAADLIYVPLATAFLEEARARGLATAGGLGMLLHQAVPGFEKWFGVRPDVTPELFDFIARDIGIG